MANIIEVENLEKMFRNEKVLHDVNFKVEKGEIFGFLGPSGAGKTTTIKILTGQLNPTAGEVKVFGETYRKLKQSTYQKRFGVLTDNSGLYERLTIYDNLKLYCSLYDVNTKRIDEVLGIVNLREEKSKKVVKLSKGMRQRVTLARTLLHESELLFLDEPTSALDPANSLHIYEGLRTLNEQGTTIFLTTHDMYEAETLCDRIAFLSNGSIQLIDEPQKIKRRFAKNTLSVTLKNDETITLPTGRDGADQLYQLMKANEVAAIHSNEPNLADIFREVTGRKLI